MQTAKGKSVEAQGRKAKLAHSYQQLLDEFSDKDLKSVGNYTLGRLIGKGSFGKVYLATHKLTNGSKVVLKSAKKGDSNLAREIHHHRQFVHPHIARLYEVIVTENLVWLVLEYCPGDELYNYLLKHGKLPVEKVQKTFAQLVGAVCYVHRQACVHRDLKLENILLDKHENVKLCDFGFTREYEGKANYLQTFCGTVCYSAPEMLKGEKYAGEKVDVWSLGVILYALLCGELPFDEDDDGATKARILTEEPKYPDAIPAEALPLVKRLLSKRPLLRPTLPEILADPFLADHAAAQRDILKVHLPAPFSTPLEKDTLHRMKIAGVSLDAVIESVLAQRCDALAGWWTLLIEKEERKARRKDQKRKEREDHRTSRRFSQASSRITALATVGEEFVKLSDPPAPRTRGRSARRRSGGYPGLTGTDSGGLGGVRSTDGPRSPDSEVPPPPIDKDSIRSLSSSRHRRPVPPPKEGVLRSARSRGSTLHLVTTSEALIMDDQVPPGPKKVKKKPSQSLIATWKTFSHWIFENTRRHKQSNKRRSHSSPSLLDEPYAGVKLTGSKDSSPRPQTSKGKFPTNGSGTPTNTAGLPKGVVANGYSAKSDVQSPASTTLSTPSNSGPPRRRAAHQQQSMSPQPLTPRSTVRRSSGPANLRGRKSTSSSVSSIRSMPHAHHHSHSKASSTSSNGSVSTSLTKTPRHSARSPHHSVKVLPATPTSSGFPSNIRLVRDRAGPSLNVFNEVMPAHPDRLMPTPTSPATRASGSPSPFGSFNLPHPGGGPNVMFAKRKKSVFKGPMLTLNRGDAKSNGSASASHSRSASATGLGRHSGEITIQEVDEDEEDGALRSPTDVDEDIEEVDAFSPITQRPGEKVEEMIFEDGEEAAMAKPSNTADTAAAG